MVACTSRKENSRLLMAGISELLKWPPVVTKRTCEWCSSPCWMKDEFPRLCQHPWSQWPADLLLDLQHCEDCVVEYHRIRDDFVKNEPQKKKNLWEGDVQRLTLFIMQALRPSHKEVEEEGNQTALELLDNFEKAQLNMDNVAQNLHVPLLEILQFPQLLFNTGLAELFLNAITILIDNGTPLILSEKYPGIYVLLVHPSQKLRKWATKTTQRLTRVSSDDYDMIKDAIQWMVGVITLNMFDNDILLVDEHDVSTSAAYLPTHLCDLKCPLEFWKGFTKLLLRLEGDVLCYKVLGVSGYRDLPDTILNAIENKGSKPLFWSAFTCLVIILERCGPRIWPMVTRQPLQVLNIITSHSVYCEELNRYKQGPQTDEQIEQGGSQDSTSGDIQRGPTNTAIGWFQPFVLSVLDYGEVTVDCVTEVIQFLDKLSGQIRKREIIFKLCNIVSRVVHSARMSSLLPTADIWVPHIVKLSSLDVKNQEVFRNIVLPAQEVIANIFTKIEDGAGRSDLKDLDFTKLKSETERQYLIERLFDHLKGTVKRLPKCKKETDFHTKTKDVSYIRKSKNPLMLSAPLQAINEGTQTSGRYRKDSSSKKGYTLKPLTIALTDYKSAQQTVNPTHLDFSASSALMTPKSFPNRVTSPSMTATSETLHTSTLSFPDIGSAYTAQTTKLKTSSHSLSTCSSTTPGVTSAVAVMPSGSTITSSTTSLSNTDKTAANTGVLDMELNKFSASPKNKSSLSRGGIGGVLLKEQQKNLGSSKANPISLDSDEEIELSENEKTEKEERYLTPERTGVKEEKQEQCHSPGDFTQMSVSPESQQFSIFKHRSLEKSINRLNSIKKTENSLDCSCLNASAANDPQAKNAPSISTRLFAAVQSNTPSKTSFSPSNDNLSTISDRSNSDERSIKQTDDKKRVWKHKNLSQLIKGAESSDETVSLEQSDDDDVVGCRRKGKKLRKKRLTERKRRPTDLESSDTDSLEERKDDSESEIDSDEPLAALRNTPKKAQNNVPSTSTSNNCSDVPMVKNQKSAPSSSGRITLNSKRLRKLKEIFKDPKIKNKICEVPKKDKKSKAISPEAEVPVLDDLQIKLETEICIDEKAPRISVVGQVENLRIFRTELDKSRRDNAEKSGEFLAMRRATEAGLNEKVTPEPKRSSNFSIEKESISSAVKETYLDDKKAKAEEKVMYEYNDKNTASSKSTQEDEISLNEISKALENDGDFNEDEWYKRCEDELLLSEEEKDNSEKDPALEEATLKLIESEEELNDVQWFATSRIRPSTSGERKDNAKEQQESKLTSIVESPTVEELTDEQLYEAYKTEDLQNYEQKKNCQELSSILDKEDEGNKEDITNDELTEAHTLQKWKNSEENKKNAIDEIHFVTNREKDEKNLNEEKHKECVQGHPELTGDECGSLVSQESTETERRVEKLLAQMDDKYGDISSDDDEATVNTSEVVLPVSEHTEDDGEMKKKLFEDLDTQDLWEDYDWDDTSAMCSQGSVIDCILEDTESLSSDEEQNNENQDPFLSPRVANLGTTDVAQAESISEAQAKVLPSPPLVPARTMPPPDLVSDSRTQKDPFQEKPAVVGPSPIFKPDAMYERILSWRVSWLDARREEIQLYSNLERMEKLPKTFDSMTDYCRRFAPILVVEAWEQAIKEWKESPTKMITTFVKGVNFSHKYTTITAMAMNVRHFAVTNRTLPEESELVILTFEGFRIFGLVDKVEQEVVRDKGSSSSDVGGSNEKTFNIKFAIRTLRTANFRPPDSSQLEIKVVASLLTSLRKWCGLVKFHQSLLARDILRPRGQRYFCQDEIPKQVKPSKVYNESQAKVIHTASEAVHQAYTLPRICLVQGPPGTGKSHTIVGIVSSILNHPKAHETSQVHSELFSEKPRILLCAPSNEAIDELMRKFVQEKPMRENMESNKENRRATDRDRNARGDNFNNCGDFCVIRVGRKSKISESVKHLSLESMTRREMAKRNSGQQEHNACNIRDQLKMIEEAIDAVERKKYILLKEETATATEENLKESKLQELKNETSSLISQKKELERIHRSQREKERGERRMETRIKKEILNSADVICTTLSGSGSTSLLNDLRGVNGKKIPFSCVIVDEACQCCELDVLIPLQYHSTKLILVGDPEQLSATVISRDAKHLLYGRSMFDRLFRVFRPIRRNERPVHLLSTQYRMHPEIAHFPSKHFYNDNIHTDSSLVKRVFPVKFPYALFDVYKGRETNDNGGSISNAHEAQMVSSICHFLIVTLGLHPSDIGIITPYRTQRAKLQALLRDGSCRDIEVKTVDGFQGGQKNVIIMSCVRTGGNIGFLDDTNRLNVALTRARHALFMFGHMNTLKNFRGWGDMLKDADTRKLIFPVDTGQDVIQVVSKANPPPSAINPVHPHVPTMPTSSVTTPQGNGNHPVSFHRSVSLVESRPTCLEPNPKYRRTQSLEERNMLQASNQSSNKCSSTYTDIGSDVRPNQIQEGMAKDSLPSKTQGNSGRKEDDKRTENNDGENYATSTEPNYAAAGLPSSVNENCTGNQNSLLQRLRQKMKDPLEDSRDSSKLDDQKSPSLIQNVEKSNSTSKLLKSSLKRPLADKDVADKPAKRIRFGTVEINRDGICHSYPIRDEEKRASPGHLQKCRDNAERVPVGGLQYKNQEETGSRVDHTPRHTRKSPTPNTHSGRKKTAGADSGSHKQVASSCSINAQTDQDKMSRDLGNDNRGVRREGNKTNVSTRDKAKVPSHLKKDGSSAVRINVVHNQEHGRSSESSTSMPVCNRKTRDDRKLNETVKRVREGQPLQRGPVVIKPPPGSHGGRGGRLHVPLHVSDEAKTGEPSGLEHWQPHGGPRNRTAQSNSSSVQNIRSRAVQQPISDNIHKSVRAKKRTQHRLADIHPKKRRR